MHEVRKYWFVLVVTLFSYSALHARHITGGELSYIYTGSSGSTHNYQITLRLYRDCFSTGAQLDPAAAISIFTKNASGTSAEVKNYTINMTSRENLRLGFPVVWIIPHGLLQVGVYIFTISLPATPYGYTITYQRCCRIENMSNVSAGTTGLPTPPIFRVRLFWMTRLEQQCRLCNKDTVIVCEDNFYV